MTELLKELCFKLLHIARDYKAMKWRTHVNVLHLGHLAEHDLLCGTSNPREKHVGSKTLLEHLHNV